MLNIAIAGAAVVLLALLLHLERAGDYRRVLPVKSALSCLFILTALIQPHPLRDYYFFILTGLVFCLAGDVFLALQHEKAFLAGLVSFLLGHIFYLTAFFRIGEMSGWVWIGTVGCVILAVAIYRWLSPHLGSMKIPVLLYIVVISAMIVGAFTTFGSRGLAVEGRLPVLCGALSFYFSDIFVARDRFIKNQFLNRLFGLPMYYLGQFLLAFSIGRF